MDELSEKDQIILRSILKDLQILFERDEIKNDEIADFLDLVESDEVKSYINSLKEAKPESALSDAFFAGRSILKKYIFETATPEAVVGDGFIDFKAKIGEKVILIELKPLFESITKKVKAGKELVCLRQIKLKPQNHRSQILKYIHEGGEYIILTNLKEWFFFNKSATAADFEPFATTNLAEFQKEFEVERNLWDYLTRLDKQSIREDLDIHFFNSLRMWVGKLSEVEFNVVEPKKTELLINLINKFIFIQTLDDYRVIEPRWIQETWEHNSRRWANKGKEKVLREFFEDVDNWFYQYYDTELFRSSVLKNVSRSKENFELLHKNLRLVLGLEYWMSALGGFRGIIQYNFRYIDEDILGKAYETYLAGVRHDEGIYYTPKFVTQYIADNTVGFKLDTILNKIKKSLEREDFEEAKALLAEITSIKVLDPACGSGSFLIKAVRKIMEKYKIVQSLLLEVERRHNKWQGSLHRPKEVEEKVAKINQITKILGPSNDRELIARILVRHIHGNDKDHKALDVAKVNIWLEAIKLSPAEFRYDRLPTETNYILPDLQMNFGNGDSLIGLPEEMTVKYLHDKHGKEISELCELRAKYIAEPSEPQLVQKTIEIKNRLNKKLEERFTDYLREKGLPADILKEAEPLHWALDFWYFYFDENGNPLPEEARGSDIVIGNPPYERIQVLNKKAPIYVKYLNKCGFKSAHWNYDLGVIFIEKGFNLTRERGEFSYIVTNKFVQADYGRAIRDLVTKNKSIREIVDFRDQQVFEDATTYTMLLFLRKIENKLVKYSCVQVLNRNYEQFIRIRDNTELIDKDLIVYNIEPGTLGAQPWVFPLPGESSIFKKLDKCDKFESFREAIFQGITTSSDPVYLLEYKGSKNGLVDVYSKSRMNHYVLEQDLLKPILKGSDIEKWTIKGHKYMLLFPYEIRNNKPELIGPEKMEKHHPRTWQYLLDNKEELESRERGRMIGKPDWYAYIYGKNLEKYEQPKVLTQVLASNSSFALDDSGTYYFVGGGNAGVYGDLLKSPSNLSLKLICALLNSSLLDWNLKRVSTPFRGGYYSYAKRFQDRLPICDMTSQKAISIAKEVENLVDSIIAYKKSWFAFRKLWHEWSSKLKGNEYSLKTILDNDLSRLREGDLKRIWTSKVDFYPREDKTETSEKIFSSFKIRGSSQLKTLEILGSDEMNRETLIYGMTFENKNLLYHIFLSIVDLLESRKKANSLSKIFSETKVPVVTPNPIENTPNIIKKVVEDFDKWNAEKGNIQILADPLSIIDKMRNAEAKVDAHVFSLYDLERKEITTVLKALHVPLSYEERVLGYIDEFNNQSK